MTEVPRTLTTVGGPWSRRSAAAASPRLPRLHREPLPSLDELDDRDVLIALVAAARNDVDVFNDLTASKPHMRAALELLELFELRTAIQHNKIRDLESAQAMAVAVDATVRRLNRELIAERDESLRLQRLHAQACRELGDTRRELAVMAARAAVHDGVCSMLARCRTERGVVPAHLTEFPDTDVVDEFELDRTQPTPIEHVAAMAATEEEGQ